MHLSPHITHALFLFHSLQGPLPWLLEGSQLCGLHESDLLPRVPQCPPTHQNQRQPQYIQVSGLGLISSLDIIVSHSQSRYYCVSHSQSMYYGIIIKSCSGSSVDNHSSPFPSPHCPLLITHTHREEWEWLKSLKSPPNTSSSPEHHSFTNSHTLQKTLLSAIDTFLHNLGISKVV